MQTKRAKRGFSLRWMLVLLISVGWVLPMLLTLTVSAVVMVRSTRERVSDIVTATVENTMELLQRDLNAAVNEALSVSYVPTIRQAYLDYQTTGNKVALLTSTRGYLNQKFYRSQLVRAAYLIYPEVEGENSTYTFSEEATTYTKASAFYEGGLYGRAGELMDTLGTEVGFFPEGDCLYLARLLSLRDNRYAPYALLVLDLNQDSLYEGLRNLPWLTDVRVELNGDGITVEGEGPGQLRMAGQTGHWLDEGQTRLTVAGYGLGERYTLDYTVRADLREPVREIGDPIGAVVVMAVFSAVMLGVVLVFFMRRVNRPIAALSRLAGRIEQGELGATTDAESLGSAEFNYLGRQMNEMSLRLSTQFERLYREELALRDARIKALQSQINPHFLGNTLEIINWEARLNGDVKVSRMLEALSTMLDAAIDRRKRPLVHLSEELHYIGAYLTIIGERLGKRLTVEKQIDDTLLDWYVPRLILQPIVENAVEHGVSPTQHGHITIRAIRHDEEWMGLEVENDRPMSAEDEARVAALLATDAEADGESSANIGIRNVHQRLRILYGPKGGLTIKNAKNGHTVSSMCIQYREKQQLEST